MIKDVPHQPLNYRNLDMNNKGIILGMRVAVAKVVVKYKFTTTSPLERMEQKHTLDLKNTHDFL